MPTPRAIRKNHDPFSHLPPLMLIRWTGHCCPHCKEVYRRTHFPEAVVLGNGRRTCSGCGTVFDDLSREWPELGTWRKLRFLLPLHIIGLFGGLLLADAIVLIFVSQNQGSWVLGVLFLGVLLGVSAIPELVWAAIRLPAIRRSTERYKAEAPPTQ